MHPRLLIDPREIVDILDEVERIFEKENMVLDIDSENIFLIGDIHGDIEAATKIFKLIEATKSTFIFLGDYVDRGPHSTEVAIGLFRLKIRNPEKIILLRGNHETTLANERYGFLTELQMKYPQQSQHLYERFNITFSKMPIAAVVNSEILAMHGGIPKNHSLADIRRVEKGDIEGSGEIILQVLWNDPDETIEYFARSIRGPGIYVYGPKAFEEFMADAGLRYLVRAHTFLIHGAQWFFKRRLLSIFSSINYAGYTVNAKIAKISNKQIKVINLLKI